MHVPGEADTGIPVVALPPTGRLIQSIERIVDADLNRGTAVRVGRVDLCRRYVMTVIAKPGVVKPGIQIAKVELTIEFKPVRLSQFDAVAGAVQSIMDSRARAAASAER